MVGNQNKHLGVALGFFVILAVLLGVAVIGVQTYNNYRSKAYGTPTGTVQGCKNIVGNPGVCATDPAFNLTNLPVQLDGSNATSLGNSSSGSYAFQNVSSGQHIVSVPGHPAGYQIVGYTMCVNSTTCHSGTPTPGSSVGVNVPSGGYVDLWWHFAPVTPTLTLTPTPGVCKTKNTGDANCDGTTDLIDYSIWLNHQCNKQAAGTACTDLRGDFNGDGSVDDADLQVWKNNYLSDTH
ncbi:MAG: hypothetical protein M1366_02215 [Patescibacteria group bacterium]|nr:hypothetical protein [Patescibacteria group bacterium]